MGETQKQIRKYAPKTDDELRQLAVDIVSGLVFTSAHIREEDLNNLLGMVFMPILFMDEHSRKELVANEIHTIYEYYSEAGPRAINGKPIFMSCRMLNRTDSQKVWSMMKRFEKKTTDFLDGESKVPPARDPNQTGLFDEEG